MVAAAVLTGALGALLILPAAKEAYGKNVYRSPHFLAVSPDGKTLYASDSTSGNVTVLDTAEMKPIAEIALNGEPRDMALSPAGDRLYVAERGAGTVAVIDTAARTVAYRIAVDRSPLAVTLAPQSKRLYVCQRDSHSVTVVDVAPKTPTIVKSIPVIREPGLSLCTPDEKRLVVLNQLPHGRGTDSTLGAEVSIIDTEKLEVVATVKLPPGSTAVKGACLSPDGKWAYVVHQLGRFNLPISQLERGWVNTYALSIIDVAKGERFVTMLLDDLTKGAANPYAVVCSKDGSQLWISHMGIHEVSLVSIGLGHELLQGTVPADLAALKDGSQANIWVRIQQDPSKISDLENDLTALYIAGAIRRAKSGGDSPRGVVLSPDEQQLYVANYFTGSVAVLAAEDGKLLGEIPLGDRPEADAVRRGESAFNDATLCFQHWHACGSCHHNGGRVDGLRWDFLRDGIGNAKDTISLIAFEHTGPYNRLGIRAAIPRECVRTGILGSHMIVPEPETVDDILAFLVQLKPEPSPRLVDGKLSEAAQRGKAIFEGKAACDDCHSGPHYTDLKTYDVGTASSNDPPPADSPEDATPQYDVPALLEGWRTAPYLHDGRALTMKDVLTEHDPKGLHGKIKGLSEQEIDDLVEYLLSI